uniref:UPAR/Ly6 domain-containing protein n=1 Tax=Salarias fasciatus TaxID=181472 RepID=A0A672HXW0_SALFA
MFVFSGDALHCYHCESDDSCIIQECASGSQCAATRKSSLRSCLSFPEQCYQGSVNYGLEREVFTSTCCSTNLCNNQSAPGNLSHKCYFCNGVECTGTLNCLGDEDYCISTTVSSGGTTKLLKGCASQEMCSLSNIPGLEEAGQVHKCCQKNLCNSASSTTAGLLLSVVPLISLGFFS